MERGQILLLRKPDCEHEMNHPPAADYRERDVCPPKAPNNVEKGPSSKAVLAVDHSDGNIDERCCSHWAGTCVKGELT